jgi:murein endopeptidase
MRTGHAIHGHGLDADKLWSRLRTRCGHGLITDADWTRTGSRKIPGRYADTNVAILWTFPDAAGKLPGCCADVARKLFGD